MWSFSEDRLGLGCRRVLSDINQQEHQGAPYGSSPICSAIGDGCPSSCEQRSFAGYNFGVGSGGREDAGGCETVRFGRPQDFLAVFVPPSPAVACPARLLPLSPRSTSSELGDNDYSR